MARDQRSADSDDDILREAQDRFDQATGYYSTFFNRALDDLKFYYGDSDNGYQWPVDVRKTRDVEKAPMLTINQTRQFTLNVVNDARQHKSDIKIDPVSDMASYEGAQVMTGIIRHIEAQSRADSVYDQAILLQAQVGIGYWRVLTRYTSDMSLDQELTIEPMPNPFMVMLDPDARQKDKSDMLYAFITESVPRDVFKARYPEFAHLSDARGLSMTVSWNDTDRIRVAEYYRLKPLRFELVSVLDKATNKLKSYRSIDLPKKIWNELVAEPDARTRRVETHEVEWYKIVGTTIVDRRTRATGDLWQGCTIPIVSVIGEESLIEGQYDCRGHVRWLKDPNRIYNYWTSAGVEQVALQTKAPWIAPARAIEGYTSVWANANTVNYSILPWNDIDDEGKPIQPPQRVQPPVMAQSYLQGMQVAQMELRMASGQWQEDMGQQSNAQSGIAINARIRQSNLSTQHFVENLGVALSYTGRILLELVPKIYDTTRVIRIIGDDGNESMVTLDPQAQAEYEEVRERQAQRAKVVFNPGFGKYAVVVEAGPSFATRRQEAFSALAQILQASPQLVPLVGDLLFKSADFPLANELAERLRRTVPPHVLGQGPSPQEQQMTAQMQQMREALSHQIQLAAERRLEDEDGLAKHAIEEFRAETERLKVLLAQLDPRQLAAVAQQATQETLQTKLPNVPAGTGNAGLRPAGTMPNGVGAGLMNQVMQAQGAGAGSPAPTGFTPPPT